MSMRAPTALVSVLRHASCSTTSLRHVRYASTAMRMPAMSPTMTEGGITGWKKQEGESFAAGDVLLEVETDKATIDVEAQDDGVMGKIIAQAGSSKIPVGQVIAMLAEEGDDLGAIEVPSDLGPENSSGSKPAPAEQDEKEKKGESAPKAEAKESGEGKSKGKGPEQQGAGHGADHAKIVSHPKPLFPSVARLLLESPLSSEQISKLKGTGKRGMLTKGDVLLALGEIKSAYGSAENLVLDIMGPSGKRKSEAKDNKPETKAAEPAKPLTAMELRRLIVAGMSKATRPAEPIVPHALTNLPLSSDAEFDAILAPYASLLPPPQPAVSIPGPDVLAEMESAQPALGSARPARTTKKDEWAGLF